MEITHRLAARARCRARWCSSSSASSVDLSTAPEAAGIRGAIRRLPRALRAAAAPSARGERDAASRAITTRPTGAAETVAQPVKVDNDLYVRDYGKCILCYKCVEACGTDAQNTFAIAVAGPRASTRGSRPKRDVPLPDSACVYCGNCIGVCPTGALMFKREYELRATGAWDEARQTRPTPSAPTAAWAARSRSTSRTTGS